MTYLKLASANIHANGYCCKISFFSGVCNHDNFSLHVLPYLEEEIYIIFKTKDRKNKSKPALAFLKICCVASGKSRCFIAKLSQVKRQLQLSTTSLGVSRDLMNCTII